MSFTENVWAFGLLLIGLIALLAVSKRRRRTKDYVESRAAESELPHWVRLTELLSMGVSIFALVIISFKIFMLLCGPTRTAATLTGASAVFLVIGIILIVFPLAFLSANFLSWVIPALRHANERAFRGHRVSFTSLNMGLIKFACVSVPIGIGALYIAAIEPWVR